jgi:hypothetical protein
MEKVLTHEAEKRADRFRKVAAEYAVLAKNAATPFLRAYFERIFRDYLLRADGELRLLARREADLFCTTSAFHGAIESLSLRGPSRTAHE